MLERIFRILTVGATLWTFFNIVRALFFEGEVRNWRRIFGNLVLLGFLLVGSYFLVLQQEIPKYGLSLHEAASERTIELPNDLPLKLAKVEPGDDVILLPFNVQCSLEGGDQVYFYVSPGPKGYYNSRIADHNPKLIFSQDTIAIYFGTQLVWIPFSVKQLIEQKKIQIQIKNKRQQTGNESSVVVDETFLVRGDLWDFSIDCSKSRLLVEEPLQCSGFIRLRPQHRGQFEVTFSVFRRGGESVIAEPRQLSLPYDSVSGEHSIAIPDFSHSFADAGEYVVDVWVRKKLGYLEPAEAEVASKNKVWADAFKHKSVAVAVAGTPKRTSIALVTIAARPAGFFEAKRRVIREALRSGPALYSPSFSEATVKVDRPFTQSFVFYKEPGQRELAMLVASQLSIPAADVMPGERAPEYVPLEIRRHEAEITVAFGIRAR